MYIKHSDIGVGLTKDLLDGSYFEDDPFSSLTNPMANQASPVSGRWLYAGPASSFPNISPSTSTTRLSDTTTTSSGEAVPTCHILQTSNVDKTNDTHTLLTPAAAADSVGLVPQIMIFQYRGNFHAVDHQCPHRSYPLSRGTLHDIEDFGIILSTGLTCPKHGWAFDVFTGESDRGSYQLRVWDVEVRSGEGDEREIWVRKKVER